MAPAADRWWLVANQLVTSIEDGFTTAGVDLPDRRLVVPGLPAWDCELLAVQLERQFSYSGNLAAEVVEPMERSAGFALRGALFAITLLRCMPTVDDDGNPPPVADEEAAAQQVLTDSQLLLNVLVAAVRAGDLGGCSSIAFVEWANVGPDGGLGGGVLRVRIG